MDLSGAYFKRFETSIIRMTFRPHGSASSAFHNLSFYEYLYSIPSIRCSCLVSHIELWNKEETEEPMSFESLKSFEPFRVDFIKIHVILTTL